MPKRTIDEFFDGDADTGAASESATAASSASAAATSKAGGDKKVKTGGWEEHDTLLYKTYGNPGPSTKMAAFDFDDTLVLTKSGKKHPTDGNDFKPFAPGTIPELQRLSNEGYKLVVFSNQKGISNERKKSHGRGGPKERAILNRFDNFVATTKLDFQLLVASDDDQYRKPSTAGLRFFEEHLNGGVTIDTAQSFYCGDAAGRVAGWKAGAKKDFACSDREFALNAKVKFMTPDELFLKDTRVARFEHEFDPRTVRMDLPLFTPTTTPLISPSTELVIMVGYPGSGKSTFVKTHLVPAGYVRVNMDELKTPAKCIKTVREALQQKQRVVLDNTSPDAATRRTYIDIAKEFGAPVRIFHMNLSRELAQHMNYFRMKVMGQRRVPSIAYNTYRSRFKEPDLGEGVKEIKKINLVPKFKDDAEKALFFEFT